MIRALLVGFTTNLAQLARQLDRPANALGARQWLGRVLQRPQFAPEARWADLLIVLPTAVLPGRRGPVPLLLDVTYCAEQWVMLQVSVPWEQRALPLFRVPQPYQGEARPMTQDLGAHKTDLPALPDSRRYRGRPHRGEKGTTVRAFRAHVAYDCTAPSYQ